MAVKAAKGIGMSSNTVAVRHPRCDVTDDRRDMCNHCSVDISVVISNVMAPKYTRVKFLIVDMVLISAGRRITALGLVQYSRELTARKGWVMSPVHKYFSPKLIILET